MATTSQGNAFQYALWNTLLVEHLSLVPGADEDLYRKALQFTSVVFETTGSHGTLSQRQSSHMDQHNDVFGSFFARHRLNKYGGDAHAYNGKRAAGLCRELFRRARTQKHVTFGPRSDMWRQRTPSDILVYIVRRVNLMGEMVPVVQERGGESHCDEYLTGRVHRSGDAS